jgi:hypothetical protein
MPARLLLTTICLILALATTEALVPAAHDGHAPNSFAQLIEVFQNQDKVGFISERIPNWNSNFEKQPIRLERKPNLNSLLEKQFEKSENGRNIHDIHRIDVANGIKRIQANEQRKTILSQMELHSNARPAVRNNQSDNSNVQQKNNLPVFGEEGFGFNLLSPIPGLPHQSNLGLNEDVSSGGRTTFMPKLSNQQVELREEEIAEEKSKLEGKKENDDQTDRNVDSNQELNTTNRIKNYHHHKKEKKSIPTNPEMVELANRIRKVTANGLQRGEQHINKHYAGKFRPK